MRRKLIVVLVFIVGGTLPFYGQKNLSVGVISGLTVSTLSEPGNIYDNEALKTGFGGGLALQYAFSQSWGLQTGIIYEQKGFRKKQHIASGNEKITGMYNYVTVPLLAEASLPVQGETRLFGLMGFYAGFKTYSENAVAASSDADIEDYTKDIQSTDAGYVIGGGIETPAGSHTMQIGFRYSQGFTEVMTASSNDRNKSVLFGVTLFF